MTRAILALALCCMGCATPRAQATPEVPRLHCVNMGSLPMATEWFVYLCSFTGQPEPEPPEEFPVALGES